MDLKLISEPRKVDDAEDRVIKNRKRVTEGLERWLSS